MGLTPKGTVKETGAMPEDLLVGIKHHNRDIKVEISKQQFKDDSGSIKGSFVVLDAGSGTYSTGIRAIIEKKKEFESADEFISLVKLQNGCEDCTHVLNANSLKKTEEKSYLEF